MGVPLIGLSSPRREISRPALDYIRHVRKEGPGDVVTVFIHEYVVDRW
ncbi:hypothetical protein I2W78_13150 [Streptomyces spinoverrucosus]|nr:hypothetical protein [Streptomyces spinoverrucosus]MBG0852760.1 hypothetical protein [Streptomyces spinoverrucosus]